VLIAGNASEVMLLQRVGKPRARMLKKHNIGQSAAKPLPRFIAMRKVQRLGEIRKGQEPLKSTDAAKRRIRYSPNLCESIRDLSDSGRS